MRKSWASTSTLLLVRTGRISGRVTNADGTPAGVGQRQSRARCLGRRAAALGGGYGSRIQDGTFAIANVPPGRYILRATGDGGRGRGRGGRGGDATIPQYAAQPLSVDGDMDGVFVTLGAAATLSGTVTIQATQTPVLPDLTQFRIVAPPADLSDFGPGGQARVERDGSFTLDGIAAGSRVIRAQAPRGWTLKSVIVDGRDVIDTPLEVRSGERISGVSLVFTDKLSEVNGTLTDQQGAPITDYTVLAFPTDAVLWRPQARQIMTARPDQNGRFQLRGLPPGDYYLAPIDPAEQGEWFEPAFLEQQRPGASRVRLGEGDVENAGLQGDRREIVGVPGRSRRSLRLPEELQHADRGDRHGVGAQRAAAERDEPDAAGRGRRALAVGPPAFGPDEHRGVRRRRHRRAAIDSGYCGVAAPGSTSIRRSAPAAARRDRSRSVSGVRISGRTARRDCLTDASATRRQRSSARAAHQRGDGRLRPLRHDRLNRRRRRASPRRGRRRPSCRP